MPRPPASPAKAANTKIGNVRASNISANEPSATASKQQPAQMQGKNERIESASNLRSSQSISSAKSAKGRASERNPEQDRFDKC
jgi:hypothetical protein